MTKIYIAKIPLVLKNDQGEDYRVAEGEAVTLTDDEYVQLSEYVTVGEAADAETASAIADAAGADGSSAGAPPDVSPKTVVKNGKKPDA